jgi:hypothetical protein
LPVRTPGRGSRERLRYKAARAHARTNISIPLPYCTSRTSYKAFGKTQPFLSGPRGSAHHGRPASALAARSRRPVRHLPGPFFRPVPVGHRTVPPLDNVGPLHRHLQVHMHRAIPWPGPGPGLGIACPALPARSENNTLYHAEIRQKRRLGMRHAKRAGRTSQPPRGNTEVNPQIRSSSSR